MQWSIQSWHQSCWANSIERRTGKTMSLDGQEEDSQSFVSLTHTRDKKSRGGSCDVSCLAIPAIYLSLCQCVCLLLLWSVFTNCEEKSLLDSGVKSDVVMRERFGVSFFKGAVTQVWRRQKWTVCSLSSTREAGENVPYPLHDSISGEQ